MYFNLKAFNEGDRTKIQLDTSAPFENNPNTIIGNPPYSQFDAKRIRTTLLYIANELIPRLVASSLKNSDKQIKSFVEEFKSNKDADVFIKNVISYMEKTDAKSFILSTTRFNYENAFVHFTQETRSSVNGDIPPPEKPKGLN